MGAYTKIDDPTAYFQAKLWTGNAGSNAITFDGNSDLQPDMFWHKEPTDTNGWHQTDTNIGIANWLATENSDNEYGVGTAYLASMNSNGFTSGSGDSSFNSNTVLQCTWAWHCNGGTTASNETGNITSTVQVDTTAGFSIVTFTGAGSDSRTIGHSLGVAPAMVIFKNRTSDNTDWRVYHQSISPTYALSLNDSGAQYSASSIFTSAFTSTLLNLENDDDVNGSSANIVAYCFADVQGYSKFASYVGNGSGTSDGTFDGRMIATGFKPAFVLIKPSSASAGDGWVLFDNTRYPRGSTMTTYSNYINNQINPGSSSAESGNVYDAVDFLSNGFKLRTGRNGINDDGRTYVYAAFAESPFVTSDDGGSIPTTAR